MKKGKKTTMGGDNKYNTGEVATLLEGLTDSITLIAEQHGEIVKSLDGINSKIDRLQEDMTDVKHELKSKVDRDEFEKLEKRVIKLERLAIAR